MLNILPSFMLVYVVFMYMLLQECLKVLLFALVSNLENVL